MDFLKVIFCGVLLVSAACSKSTSSNSGNGQFGNKLEMPETKPIDDRQLHETGRIFKSSIEMVNAVEGSSHNQVISSHCQLVQKSSSADQTVDVVSTLIDLPPETCPVDYMSHMNGRGVNTEELVSFRGTVDNNLFLKDASFFPETTLRRLADRGLALVQIQKVSQRSSHIQGRYELDGNAVFENSVDIPFIHKNDTDLTISTDENGATTVNGRVSVAYGAKLEFGWVVLRIEAQLTGTQQIVKCLVNDRDISTDPLCSNLGNGSLETKSLLNNLWLPSFPKISI